jgi:hypothetical protein
VSDLQLPPCGLYRTTAPIGTVPEGRLVYFHNHGEPGPGIYLPRAWKGNRAEFDPKGHVLASPSAVAHLEPLEPEGFYRVTEPFECCEKRCRTFAGETLVQLGYDAAAHPILFEPRIVDSLLEVPERGFRIDADHLPRLRPLKVAVHKSGKGEEDDGRVLH